MDASSGDRSSPRTRQLQGPRPPRLAVSKDSHKVRKPPIAPQRHQHLQQQQQQQQQVVQHQHQHQYPQQARQPVIIYDASPKVIHTKPGDFMALVQRLTGPGSTSQAQFDVAASGSGAVAGPSPDVPSSQAMEFEPREFLLSPTAALSPAARLAAIERSVRPLPPHAHPAAAHAPPSYYGGAGAADDDFFLSASASADLDSFAAALSGGGLPSVRPGILSPAALPPAASTGLFSPMPFDPSCLSWLSELSPFLPSAGTRAEQQAPFAPSPRSSLLLATPTMPSPATFSVLEFFSSGGGGFQDM